MFEYDFQPILALLANLLQVLGFAALIILATYLIVISVVVGARIVWGAIVDG